MPAIRAKADALERRGPRRINLAAETIGLLVAALRHLATEEMVERKASYRVEVWDASGNYIVEHIGSLSNHVGGTSCLYGSLRGAIRPRGH